MKNIVEKTEEDYFKHIDKYLQEPVVQDVLINRTSFKKEIENFYKMHPYFPSRRCPSLEFSLEEKDKPKEDIRNSKLIEIISPFSDGLIDLTLLGQNPVREDFKNSQKNKRNYVLKHMMYMVTNMFTSMVAAGMTAAGTLDYLRGTPLVVIPLYLWIKDFSIETSKNSEDRWGESRNYDEFIKLWNASKKADNFISNSYNPFLIK